MSARALIPRILVIAGNLVGVAAFCWPFVVPAFPVDAQAAVPWAAIAVVPFVAICLGFAFDHSVRSAKTLALLGTLTAVAAAARIAGAGVGGIEIVFILLVLAGYAYGPRFGFLLGMLTIVLSSIVFGGFGPWTPFQMLACGWVGAGAGLLPRMPAAGSSARAAGGRGIRLRRAGEIAMLAAYGVVAAYLFGLVMNLWFWPFAVGSGAGISYAADASFGQNLASFWLYSLVTSTLSWDTLRAITTAVGIAVAGPAVLAALRRAKLGRGEPAQAVASPAVIE